MATLLLPGDPLAQAARRRGETVCLRARLAGGCAMRAPTIDLGPLADGEPWRHHIAQQIDWACTEFGIFYLIGHEIDGGLSERLFGLGRQFFNRSSRVKARIHTSRSASGGNGYFGVGEERTADIPNIREGINFAAAPAPRALDSADPWPLEDSNLFPQIPGFRDCVLEYLAAVTALGRRLAGAIAAALGADPQVFTCGPCEDPTVRLQLLNYPPGSGSRAGERPRWGLPEHTDRVVLSLLKHESTEGLQVRRGAGWMDMPEVPHTFLCGVGEALERLTGGRYRAAAYRVANRSRAPRIAAPLLIDWNLDSKLIRFPGGRRAGAAQSRAVRPDAGAA